jgi:hypothetical protein
LVCSDDVGDLDGTDDERSSLVGLLEDGTTLGTIVGLDDVGDLDGADDDGNLVGSLEDGTTLETLKGSDEEEA